MRGGTAIVLLICSSLLASVQADIDDLLMTPEEEEEEKLNKEAMAEAMAADRGYRQEDGTREEWETQAEHTGKKYDSKGKEIRRSLEERLHDLLETNDLSCDGCTIEQMKKMLNSVGEIRKEREERRKWNRTLLEYVGLFVGFGMVGAICYFVSPTKPKGPTMTKQEQVHTFLFLSMASCSLAHYWFAM
jgi:hypothetical protein